MNNLIYEFLNLVLSLKIREYPFRTSDIIYDIRFTEEWYMDYISSQYSDDEFYTDAGNCYKYLFKEIEKINRINICDSHDINEEYPGGQYIYSYGFIDDNIPFIHHESMEYLQLPTRITIYHTDRTMELTADSKYIDIYETVPRIRDIFYSDNPVYNLKTFLRNSDRPIYTAYE